MDETTRRAVLEILDQVEAHIVSCSARDSEVPVADASAAELLARIRGLRRRVEAGDRTVAHGLDFLFLPTGELQDLSIDAGWGDEFLDLAARYDALALGRGMFTGSVFAIALLVLAVVSLVAFTALGSPD